MELYQLHHNKTVSFVFPELGEFKVSINTHLPKGFIWKKYYVYIENYKYVFLSEN